MPKRIVTRTRRAARTEFGQQAFQGRVEIRVVDQAGFTALQSGQRQQNQQGLVDGAPLAALEDAQVREPAEDGLSGSDRCSVVHDWRHGKDGLKKFAFKLPLQHKKGPKALFY